MSAHPGSVWHRWTALRGAFVGATMVAAMYVGCSATQHPTETASAEPTLLGEPAIHIRESDEEPVDAGPSRELHSEHGDGGATIAVSAEAGALGGEITWLLAHIQENPDRLRNDDSPNVRQLAEHGAEGIRAVAELFERGDAERVPFARRVVERAIQRSCRHRDLRTIYSVASWIELGESAERTTRDAGLTAWSRPEDAPWPRAAVHRLLAWADAGMPCRLITVDAGDDVGAQRASDAMDAAVTD